MWDKAKPKLNFWEYVPYLELEAGTIVIFKFYNIFFFLLMLLFLVLTESSKKCCMEFLLVLDLLKFQWQKYWLELLPHLQLHPNQKVVIFYKFLILKVQGKYFNYESLLLFILLIY